MLTWDDADLAAVGPSAWRAYEALAGHPPEPPPAPDDEPPFEHESPPSLGPPDTIWVHRCLDDVEWSWGTVSDILDRVWDAYAPEGSPTVEVPLEHLAFVTIYGLGILGFTLDYSCGIVSCGDSRWLREPRGGFHRVI